MDWVQELGMRPVLLTKVKSLARKGAHHDDVVFTLFYIFHGFKFCMLVFNVHCF